MASDSTVRTVAKIAKRALAIEVESEVGKLNALGMTLVFALIVLAGVRTVWEATLASIFQGGAPPSFPLITVLLIYIGCMFVCLGFAAGLAPLIKNWGTRRK